jgi:hypothetical protein
VPTVYKRQLPNPGGQLTFAFGIASFSLFAGQQCVLAVKDKDYACGWFAKA